MKRKAISIGCILLSAVLMTLPGGIPMVFSTISGTTVKAYSYFSTIPFGYGNWMPALAILCTALVLILLLIPRNLNEAISACLFISVASHIVSWILLHSFSPISLAVMLLHLFVLLYQPKKFMAS